MAGLPGLRGAEHLGITVPDLDEAERFLVDVLGAELIYSLGPFVRDDASPRLSRFDELETSCWLRKR